MEPGGWQEQHAAASGGEWAPVPCEKAGGPPWWERTEAEEVWGAAKTALLWLCCAVLCCAVPCCVGAWGQWVAYEGRGWEAGGPAGRRARATEREGVDRVSDQG